MGFKGKEINLTQPTVEQTEDLTPRLDSDRIGEAPLPAAGEDTGASDLPRRQQSADTLVQEDPAPAAEKASPESQNGDLKTRRNGRRHDREARRQERRARPRAPRAEQGTATVPSDAPAVELRDDSVEQAFQEELAATPLLGLDYAPDTRRGSHKVARAQKRQRSAMAAMESADDNPALGALNRHLNMLMHQLATAHRVIGRVAAERDALRQQLADLQGVPVEEITVTTIGAASFEDHPAKSAAPRSSSTSSSKTSALVAKLNYFNAEDIAVARKRRQMLALVLLTVIVSLWFTSRIGFWTMPANLSRDSLGDLPYIGDLVSLFLAGWIFYRVFRVSSRGVRWVFPSDDQRRRRR